MPLVEHKTDGEIWEDSRGSYKSTYKFPKKSLAGHSYEHLVNVGKDPESANMLHLKNELENIGVKKVITSKIKVTVVPDDEKTGDTFGVALKLSAMLPFLKKEGVVNSYANTFLLDIRNFDLTFPRLSGHTPSTNEIKQSLAKLTSKEFQKFWSSKGVARSALIKNIPKALAKKSAKARAIRNLPARIDSIIKKRPLRKGKTQILSIPESTALKVINEEDTRIAKIALKKVNKGIREKASCLSAAQKKSAREAKKAQKAQAEFDLDDLRLAAVRRNSVIDASDFKTKKTFQWTKYIGAAKASGMNLIESEALLHDEYETLSLTTLRNKWSSVAAKVPKVSKKAKSRAKKLAVADEPADINRLPHTNLKNVKAGSKLAGIVAKADALLERGDAYEPVDDMNPDAFFTKKGNFRAKRYAETGLNLGLDVYALVVTLSAFSPNAYPKIIVKVADWYLQLNGGDPMSDNISVLPPVAQGPRVIKSALKGTRPGRSGLSVKFSDATGIDEPIPRTMRDVKTDELTLIQIEEELKEAERSLEQEDDEKAEFLGQDMRDPLENDNFVINPPGPTARHIDEFELFQQIEKERMDDMMGVAPVRNVSVPAAKKKAVKIAGAKSASEITHAKMQAEVPKTWKKAFSESTVSKVPKSVIDSSFWMYPEQRVDDTVMTLVFIIDKMNKNERFNLGKKLTEKKRPFYMVRWNDLGKLLSSDAITYVVGRKYMDNAKLRLKLPMSPALDSGYIVKYLSIIFNVLSSQRGGLASSESRIETRMLRFLDNVNRRQRRRNARKQAKRDKKEKIFNAEPADSELPVAGEEKQEAAPVTPKRVQFQQQEFLPPAKKETGPRPLFDNDQMSFSSEEEMSPKVSGKQLASMGLGKAPSPIMGFSDFIRTQREEEERKLEEFAMPPPLPRWNEMPQDFQQDFGEVEPEPTVDHPMPALPLLARKSKKEVNPQIDSVVEKAMKPRDIANANLLVKQNTTSALQAAKVTRQQRKINAQRDRAVDENIELLKSTQGVKPDTLSPKASKFINTLKDQKIHYSYGGQRTGLYRILFTSDPKRDVVTHYMSSKLFENRQLFHIILYKDIRPFLNHEGVKMFFDYGNYGEGHVEKGEKELNLDIHLDRKVYGKHMVKFVADIINMEGMGWNKAMIRKEIDKIWGVTKIAKREAHGKKVESKKNSKFDRHETRIYINDHKFTLPISTVAGLRARHVPFYQIPYNNLSRFLSPAAREFVREKIVNRSNKFLLIPLENVKSTNFDHKVRKAAAEAERLMKKSPYAPTTDVRVYFHDSDFNFAKTRAGLKQRRVRFIELPSLSEYTTGFAKIFWDNRLFNKQNKFIMVPFPINDPASSLPLMDIRNALETEFEEAEDKTIYPTKPKLVNMAPLNTKSVRTSQEVADVEKDAMAQHNGIPLHQTHTIIFPESPKMPDWAQDDVNVRTQGPKLSTEQEADLAFPLPNHETAEEIVGNRFQRDFDDDVDSFDEWPESDMDIPLPPPPTAGNVDSDSSFFDELAMKNDTRMYPDSEDDFSTIRNCEEWIVYDKCPICQEHLNCEKSEVTLLCSHEFHADCIRQWLYIESSCPMCKQQVSEYMENGSVLKVKKKKQPVVEDAIYDEPASAEELLPSYIVPDPTPAEAAVVEARTARMHDLLNSDPERYDELMYNFDMRDQHIRDGLRARHGEVATVDIMYFRGVCECCEGQRHIHTDDEPCDICGQRDYPCRMVSCDNDECKVERHVWCNHMHDFPLGNWYCSSMCKVQARARHGLMAVPFTMDSDEDDDAPRELVASLDLTTDAFSNDSLAEFIAQLPQAQVMEEDEISDSDLVEDSDSEISRFVIEQVDKGLNNEQIRIRAYARKMVSEIVEKHLPANNEPQNSQDSFTDCLSVVEESCSTPCCRYCGSQDLKYHEQHRVMKCLNCGEVYGGLRGGSSDVFDDEFGPIEVAAVPVPPGVNAVAFNNGTDNVTKARTILYAQFKGDVVDDITMNIANHRFLQGVNVNTVGYFNQIVSDARQQLNLALSSGRAQPNQIYTPLQLHDLARNQDAVDEGLEEDFIEPPRLVMPANLTAALDANVGRPNTTITRFQTQRAITAMRENDYPSILHGVDAIRSRILTLAREHGVTELMRPGMSISRSINMLKALPRVKRNRGAQSELSALRARGTVGVDVTLNVRFKSGHVTQRTQRVYLDRSRLRDIKLGRLIDVAGNDAIINQIRATLSSGVEIVGVAQTGRIMTLVPAIDIKDIKLRAGAFVDSNLHALHQDYLPTARVGMCVLDYMVLKLNAFSNSQIMVTTQDLVAAFSNSGVDCTYGISVRELLTMIKHQSTLKNPVVKTSFLNVYAVTGIGFYPIIAHKHLRTAHGGKKLDLVFAVHDRHLYPVEERDVQRRIKEGKPFKMARGVFDYDPQVVLKTTQDIIDWSRLDERKDAVLDLDDATPEEKKDCRKTMNGVMSRLIGLGGMENITMVDVSLNRFGDVISFTHPKTLAILMQRGNHERAVAAYVREKNLNKMIEFPELEESTPCESQVSKMIMVGAFGRIPQLIVNSTAGDLLHRYIPHAIVQKTDLYQRISAVVAFDAAIENCNKWGWDKPELDPLLKGHVFGDTVKLDSLFTSSEQFVDSTNKRKCLFMDRDRAFTNAWLNNTSDYLVFEPEAFLKPYHGEKLLTNCAYMVDGFEAIQGINIAPSMYTTSATEELLDMGFIQRGNIKSMVAANRVMAADTFKQGILKIQKDHGNDAKWIINQIVGMMRKCKTMASNSYICNDLETVNSQIAVIKQYSGDSFNETVCVEQHDLKAAFDIVCEHDMVQVTVKETKLEKYNNAFINLNIMSNYVVDVLRTVKNTCTELAKGKYKNMRTHARIMSIKTDSIGICFPTEDMKRAFPIPAGWRDEGFEGEFAKVHWDGIIGRDLKVDKPVPWKFDCPPANTPQSRRDLDISSSILCWGPGGSGKTRMIFEKLLTDIHDGLEEEKEEAEKFHVFATTHTNQCVRSNQKKIIAELKRQHIEYEVGNGYISTSRMRIFCDTLCYMRAAHRIKPMPLWDMVIIDEIATVPLSLLRFLRYNMNVKENCSFVLAGDFKQTEAVADNGFDTENSLILKELCSFKRIFFDLVLGLCRYIDQYSINGMKYIWEHDRLPSQIFCNKRLNREDVNSIAYTNAEVDRRICEAGKSNDKLVAGDKVFVVSCGSGYNSKSRQMKKGGVYNNAPYVIVDRKKDQFLVKSDDFCPEGMWVNDNRVKSSVCITTHKIQGQTIEEKFNIYQLENMPANVRYTAISRARDIRNIGCNPVPFHKLQGYKAEFKAVYVYLERPYLYRVEVNPCGDATYTVANGGFEMGEKQYCFLKPQIKDPENPMASIKAFFTKSVKTRAPINISRFNLTAVIKSQTDKIQKRGDDYVYNCGYYEYSNDVRVRSASKTMKRGNKAALVTAVEDKLNTIFANPANERIVVMQPGKKKRDKIKEPVKRDAIRNDYFDNYDEKMDRVRTMKTTDFVEGCVKRSLGDSRHLSTDGKARNTGDVINDVFSGDLVQHKEYKKQAKPLNDAIIFDSYLFKSAYEPVVGRNGETYCDHGFYSTSMDETVKMVLNRNKLGYSAFNQEICGVTHDCQMTFDLDRVLRENEVMPNTKELLGQFGLALGETFLEAGLFFNIDLMRVTKSQSKRKLSYHIVYPEMFPDLTFMKLWVQKQLVPHIIKNKVKFNLLVFRDLEGKTKCIVDDSIYSKNRAMRMPLCKKAGKDNKLDCLKLVEDEWVVLDIWDDFMGNAFSLGDEIKNDKIVATYKEYVTQASTTQTFYSRLAKPFSKFSKRGRKSAPLRACTAANLNASQKREMEDLIEKVNKMAGYVAYSAMEASTTKDKKMLVALKLQRVKEGVCVSCTGHASHSSFGVYLQKENGVWSVNCWKGGSKKVFVCAALS